MRFKLLLLSILLSVLSYGQQEKINAFHAEIAIDTSSVIRVTETIAIEAYGKEFKRGIVRYLPKEKKDSLGNRVSLNYKILTVKKDGLIEPYHTATENGNLVIYVGNKNRYISSGNHEYQITYTAENTLSYYSDFDELYWNVNGFGWNFIIDDISATITLPSGAKLLQTACYTGSYGSTATNCSGEIKDNQAIFNGSRLYSKQNLTIAVGFEKGVIYQPPPPPPPSFFEQYGLLLLSIILIIGLMIYYIITWSLFGIDPAKPTVYPLFDAPHNLSPASVGMLHKERYWGDLITASLVNLGIKGFLKIEEEEYKELWGLYKSKTFKITKIKEPTADLPIEEKTLMESFFRSSNHVNINGSYDSNLEDSVNAFQRTIKSKHNDLINEGNNYKFLIFPTLIIFGFTFLGIYYGFNKENSIPLLFFISGILNFLPILLFALLIRRIRKLFSLKWVLVLLGFITILIIFIFVITRPYDPSELNIYSILGFLLFGVISLGLYQYLIKKPSAKKLKIQSEIEGFEMYLKTAEERQLQQFNPPKVTPEVFEKYLPYAIALDADKIWGAKFQQYLSQSSTSQDYQTTWYTGSNFNAMNFGHALNSNLSNAISSSSTPPSSSSSGSGGGGFSGGGVGGGGGGGW
ncbi:MAG: DUF2207 domain-containing protein [Weeksellaceae bacterium]